jgi:hypothetical protein
MSRDLKYHAEIDFNHGRKTVRFTAVDLERLMARFKKEVDDYQKALTEAREYIWVEVKLITEVCSSWREFEEYEH